MHNKFIMFSLSLVLAGFISANQPAVGFQSDEVPQTEEEKAIENSSPNKDKPASQETDEPLLDTSSPAETKTVPKRFAQLHLQDGSIIGGEVQLDQIHVKTEFGRLTVPIERIIRILPGLDSQPKKDEQISLFIRQLGSPKLDDREAAQKGLIGLGLEIRNLLRNVDDGGNAEFKKRLAEIRTTFDQELESLEDEGLAPPRHLVRGDQVETKDFTIVGEIEEKEFKVKSKFGQLLVQLGDIKTADRSIKQSKPDVRKTVSVRADSFFQRTPTSTKIRVSKGDKIVIKADGIMNWTNWNSSCSPDGIANRGDWNGFQSGTLVARIGSDNKRCVKVGRKGDFVAAASGILYLGVAMRDSYANNTHYNWTGEYKAKITVSPKQD